MRIFTGIQPTGTLTLGNYLGSIKNFKKTINPEDESFFCIVDLHALTVTPDAKTLRENIKSLCALYIALDLHEITNIFVQSNVRAHSELAWLLQCHTRNGELERMTQYKDKSQKNINVSTGLFTYPVLMAADILLYDTDVVPVGVDQKQHIELTRDLAERVNSFYKQDLFKMPEPKIEGPSAKIYSLTDPTKKMSKSDDNPKSYISMLDDEKTIIKKIKSATTDSIGEINFDPENQPGVSNLLTIFATCRSLTMDETVAHFKDQGYGFLKSEVAQAICDELLPIQEKYFQIMENETLINKSLQTGTQKANEVAEAKIKEVKEAFGLYI